MLLILAVSYAVCSVRSKSTKTCLYVYGILPPRGRVKQVCWDVDFQTQHELVICETGVRFTVHRKAPKFCARFSSRLHRIHEGAGVPLFLDIGGRAVRDGPRSVDF